MNCELEREAFRKLMVSKYSWPDDDEFWEVDAKGKFIDDEFEDNFVLFRDARAALSTEAQPPADTVTLGREEYEALKRDAENYRDILSFQSPTLKTLASWCYENRKTIEIDHGGVAFLRQSGKPAERLWPDMLLNMFREMNRRRVDDSKPLDSGSAFVYLRYILQNCVVLVGEDMVEGKDVLIEIDKAIDAARTGKDE